MVKVFEWSNFSIESPRLHLIYLDYNNLAHAVFMTDLVNTSACINAFGDLSINTPERFARYVRTRVHPHYARYGYGLFMVLHKPHKYADVDESKPIGMVSLNRSDSHDACVAPQLQFAIMSSETLHGYATEAAKTLLDYAKRELGIESACAFSSVRNAHGASVLKKVGLEFREIGDLTGSGSDEGKVSVWVLPGMSQDLSVYRLSVPLACL
ncbi:Acyl-CoA N-acyltransferase [Penicillium verhagenii]|nr:Acyl-CoA N-acyltransferase [Penicillium verhagenii]